MDLMLDLELQRKAQYTVQLMGSQVLKNSNPFILADLLFIRREWAKQF